MDKIKGYRKLIGFGFTTIIFALIVILNPTVNVYEVATALGIIYGIFAGGNVLTHFTEKKSGNETN